MSFLRRLERLEQIVAQSRCKPELLVFVGPDETQEEAIEKAAAVYGLSPEECEVKCLWVMRLK